ncbi:MAG TPA: hypothetical protein VK469_00745, partial [Candidatus Kapabacteria bacterium]|nr:hypothetical protein [Candidatus Kapabacteria bacterium]
WAVFLYDLEKLFHRFKIREDLFLKKIFKGQALDSYDGNDKPDFETFYFLAQKYLFSQTLRDHYKRWIPQEIEILKKYPSKNIESVIQFYESLMKKLEAGVLLLHVGFGTGWQSKTGAFLEKNRFMWRNDIQDYLNKCKSAYQREKHIFTRVQRDGRYKNYPFPKSRKFVMSGNALHQPGWVEIREEEVKP